VSDSFREVGRLEDLDGSDIVVGVDRGRVVIDYGPPLTQLQAERFGQLYVSACWEAARDCERMAEALAAPGGAP
jgi:hypothetical protein